MHTWTQYWGLQINQVKTQSTVFSLSTTKEQVKIKLGDRILAQAETPIYLGATLDSRLSWKSQIESMRKRGIQKLALLNTGTVLPTLEYGASVWATAKTDTNKLDQKYRIWASEPHLVQ